MTSAITRAPRVAWSVDVSGTIEREPLVWDDDVVVAVTSAKEKHALHVLRLLDGVLVAKTKGYSTPANLEPSLWEDRVLIRTSPNEVTLLEIPRRKKSLRQVWRYTADAPIDSSLLFADEIYLTSNGSLFRMDASSKTPRWQLDGHALKGQISLRGDHVYVCGSNRGIATLAKVSRDRGVKVDGVPLGGYMIDGPPLGSKGIEVFSDYLQVRHATPVVAGEEFNTSMVAETAEGNLELIDLQNTYAAASESDGRRLQLMKIVGPVLAFFTADHQKYIPLATIREHVEFVKDPIAPTVVGKVVLMGAKAFESKETEVLWNLDLAVDRRAVPARESVLVVEQEGTRLTALRDDPRALGGPPTIAEEGEQWLNVLLRDGSQRSGTMQVDLATREMTRTVGRAAPTSFDDVLVAVDKEDNLRFVVDGIAAVRGLALLFPDDSPQEATQRLLALYAALPAGISGSFRIALLRACEKSTPNDAGVMERVKSLLPEGITVSDGSLSLRDWLDFAEATTRSRVTIVPSEFKETDEGLTLSQRQLGATRAFWRGDLRAVESENLLVITPLERPGRVALCLAMGELVCQTLEAMFATDQPKRLDRSPLRLELYESEEEYLRQSERLGVSVASLEWTAGHYSRTADVTRLFLPADKDAFQRVMQVYAHELTHHWVERRSPRFGTEERRGGAGTPGYWLVEGFASLVDEFLFSLDEWSVETINPRAESLDVVANSKAFLPWPSLYAFSQEEFAKLKPDPVGKVVTRWRLGSLRPVSQIGMFYDQAAATCQFLYHADQGRHREALLELVTLYYTGKYTIDDVERLTGYSPTDLSKQVIEYARQRMGF